MADTTEYITNSEMTDYVSTSLEAWRETLIEELLGRGARPQPSGSIDITSNGTYDVARYETANVNVVTPIPEDISLDPLYARYFPKMTFYRAYNSNRSPSKVPTQYDTNRNYPYGSFDISNQIPLNCQWCYCNGYKNFIRYIFESQQQKTFTELFGHEPGDNVNGYVPSVQQQSEFYLSTYHNNPFSVRVIYMPSASAPDPNVQITSPIYQGGTFGANQVATSPSSYAGFTSVAITTPAMFNCTHFIIAFVPTSWSTGYLTNFVPILDVVSTERLTSESTYRTSDINSTMFAKLDIWR